MRFIKENYFFIVLIVVILSVAAFQLDKLSVDEGFMEIVIDDGDTLWDLAVNYADAKTPPHHWIEQVKSLNELQSDQIKSGELLRLPVKMDRQPDNRLAEMGEGADE
ncbi:LysM peptidoglycan-binding domain-containing protein [Sporosarcina sp.]|uniref:cell division suppressor protein YneA n=1 Tax=Sporosarcina sp. TaxID=49982 RepID=UPI002603CC3E|nr:LysM peptidoglycan-binding domain-containing protein [Sporosarcina sp.]